MVAGNGGMVTESEDKMGSKTTVTAIGSGTPGGGTAPTGPRTGARRGLAIAVVTSNRSRATGGSRRLTVVAPRPAMMIIRIPTA